MAKKASSRPKEFTIPVELLKAFQSDVRTIASPLPNNGYIVFDRKMLTSMLLSGNVAARTQLAKQINRLGEAGGELVIVKAK